MKVEVYGPGCAKCRQSYDVIRKYLDEKGLAHEVVKIESIDAMMALGIISTPAIALDGKVVLKGRVPTTSDLQKLFG